MKGCRHNSRLKICQPGPGTTVEPPCVRLDNRCYTEDEYEKKTGSKFIRESPKTTPVPTIRSIAPLTTTGRKTPRPISEVPLPTGPLTFPKLIQKGFSYLSGPVSWYYFKGTVGDNSEERQFHFFGDAHFSKDNNCQH